MSSEERKKIQSIADSIGLSVSPLLRQLGLLAPKLNGIEGFLRTASSRLLRLKRMSAQQQQLDSDQVQAAINEALEPLDNLEQALTAAGTDPLESQTTTTEQ